MPIAEQKMQVRINQLKRRVVRHNQVILNATFDRDWPKQPTSMNALVKELDEIFNQFKDLYCFAKLKDSAFIQDQVHKALHHLRPDGTLQAKHNEKHSPEHQN